MRAIQTAAAAARALGVGEVAVEPGMAEIMSDKWFGHWAVAGADSTWGGPQTKGPQPARPEAATPAGRRGGVARGALLRDNDIIC